MPRPRCKLCNHEYKDNYALNRHLSRITPCVIIPSEINNDICQISNETVIEDVRNKCIYCLHTFSTSSNYTKHKEKCKLKDDPIRLLEIEHKIDIKFPDNKLECRFCNCILSRVDNLKTHLETCKKRQEYLTKLQKMKIEKQKLEELERQKIEKSEKNKSKTNILYLIQEREFVNLNKPVYKIGRSKQEGFKRFNDYPKGSVIKIMIECDDCVLGERILLNIFRKKYIQRSDIGSEYFEGSMIDMRDDICNYVLNESKLCS
jgi:hypothetical protein